MIAPPRKIWGYETNFGSFAQFTLVQSAPGAAEGPQI